MGFSKKGRRGKGEKGKKQGRFAMWQARECGLCAGVILTDPIMPGDGKQAFWGRSNDRLFEGLNSLTGPLTGVVWIVQPTFFQGGK